MSIFLIFAGLIVVAILYGKHAVERRASLNNFINSKKQFKVYLTVSLLTLLFFLISFGIIFYKETTNLNPPQTDNGLGMALVILIPPFLLTIITLIFSGLALLLTKPDTKIKALGIITGLLTIPVGVFGILCIVATIMIIIKQLLLQ